MVGNKLVPKSFIFSQVALLIRMTKSTLLLLSELNALLYAHSSLNFYGYIFTNDRFSFLIIACFGWLWLCSYDS